MSVRGPQVESHCLILWFSARVNEVTTTLRTLLLYWNYFSTFTIARSDANGSSREWFVLFHNWQPWGVCVSLELFSSLLLIWHEQPCSERCNHQRPCFQKVTGRYYILVLKKIEQVCGFTLNTLNDVILPKVMPWSNNEFEIAFKLLMWLSSNTQIHAFIYFISTKENCINLLEPDKSIVMSCPWKWFLQLHETICMLPLPFEILGIINSLACT